MRDRLEIRREPRGREAGDAVRAAGARDIPQLQRLHGNRVTAWFLQRAAHSKEAVSPVEEPARVRHPVYAPSSAHQLEDLADNYKNIANHDYGFSVAPKAVMAADTALINAFVAAWSKDGRLDDFPDLDWEDDVGGTKKIEYTVNGRTYSTHETTTQLYPLRGPEVLRGRGARDMAAYLKRLKLDTEKRRIILAQLYEGQRDGEWGTNARAVKAARKAESKEALEEPKGSGGASSSSSSSSARPPKPKAKAAATVGKVETARLLAVYDAMVKGHTPPA